MRALLAATLVLLLGTFLFWPHTTGPTEVGVRVAKWDPLHGSGVLREVYPPGALYFFPAVLTTGHARHQASNLVMTFDPIRGDRGYR